MGAKDLMIGDWVRIKKNVPEDDAYLLPDRIEPGMAIPVDEILWCGINVDWYGGEINGYITFDAIEPIPLTAEILEKNFDKRPECYGIFDDYFDFMVREYSDGIFIANYHHCEMSLPDTQIADIAFVHELQHSLKLCGIEKEIQLKEIQ